MKNKATSQFIRMTEEPIPRLIISLGIPTTISMLITNVYNMADTFFVGKLGTSASGAVGIVFGLMAILQAFGFMFGQGAGSIIARKLGEQDAESASEYATISFFLSILTGIVIGILGISFIHPFLRLLGSTETILPFARTYALFILVTGPLMIGSFVLNNILRFEGKAALAMRGLVTGAILNIFADPIFMFVFDMGIAGAGLSTALSQTISFGILISYFLRGKTQSKVSIRKFSFDGRKTWQIVSTGFPALVRQGLTSISTMLLNQSARIYGDAAVAAMSIVSRISFFIFAVGLGVGQGYQPVCGFNYGAGKNTRVRKAFSFTLLLSQVLLSAVAIGGLLVSNHAIGWFRNDPEVVRIGSLALKYQCISLFFQPLVVMGNMTFQSVGKRGLATFTSMMKSGVYFIPALLLLTKLFGITGIQLAQPVADILTFVTILPLTIVFFKRLPKDRIQEEI